MLAWRGGHRCPADRDDEGILALKQRLHMPY
ncbi:hypothetical protein HNQ39_000921 [Armatimonas rosea]|uniref:Uncharacterized protein n=1 Tax=Armatimonas rosea TaxID=685828 RepID=A0A7W9W478_ARMRO|nr:hypothetical protein [Armatimonas rosea]